jgi:hypothetical protein
VISAVWETVQLMGFLSTLGTQSQFCSNRDSCMRYYQHENCVTYVGGGGCIRLPMCTAWRHLGCGGVAPLIINVGTRWNWMVSCTPRPLHSRGDGLRYPLNRRLAGPQTGLEFWRREKCLALPRIQWRFRAGLSPRRCGFSPRSVHGGFVGDKVTLGQVFPRIVVTIPTRLSWL